MPHRAAAALPDSTFINADGSTRPMSNAHYERAFEDSGKSFAALLNKQEDGRFSVTVRLPDGTLRIVPGEHFADEDQAMSAACSFAHELVGSC
jgi:hypothetical protein